MRPPGTAVRDMWRRKKQPMQTTTAATIARIKAEVDLEERHADTGRVRALTDEWRRIRERNNIAYAFEASLRGGRP